MKNHVITSVSMPVEYQVRLDHQAKLRGLNRSEFVRLLIDLLDKLKGMTRSEFVRLVNEMEDC